MNYFVYILKSTTTGRYYIGSSNDVHRRLKEHNNGKVRSTRKRGPYQVVYVEPAASRSAAYSREMQIKSYKGGMAFKKLVASYNSSGIV